MARCVWGGLIISPVHTHPHPRAGWPVGAGLALGWAADRLMGDPAQWHPVAGFGCVAARLEHRMWRPSRARGAAYAALLVGAGAAVAGGLRRAAAPSTGTLTLLTAALTWTALGCRSLEHAGDALAAALEVGDLDGARALLPTLAGRDPRCLDGAEFSRAGIESVAENTADAVIGPLVWGMLAGPAGTVAYRAANTLDAMVGHRSERYLAFGWAAARLDDVLGWPGARLGAALAVVAAPLVGGDAGRAWRTLRRDGASHPSPNAGRLEAAFAGALGVRLGGTNTYGDRVEHRPPLGEGPPPGPADLRRAVRLSRLTGTAAAALCVVAALLVRARR